ncbi:M61 family metallopeptidase [Mucilaginibacter ginkgonis]|uniref:M61 family metallopeptidase n=1 Tax=Mucilaginibacter ginkgonis TaxID=2682091 RepID=A0A6I4INC8_9SPHI|nr:PDZ domain-containing protein [Mucilaginibacter ginkgonis]QQL49290.1 M61 family metallopeptidase [Mucilaginibacter ginkgonis]
MKKLLLAACASAVWASSFAQNPVVYEFSFPNIKHHEAEITMKLSAVPAGPLKVRMSRSSPGRYATHEFGKNVYNVKAFDGKGTPIKIDKVEGDVYTVPAHGADVKITYTLFGNWTDGTYVGLDESHAHLNMPGTLMWAYGFDKRPIRIHFNELKANNWRVATQLKPEGNNTYSGPDLQYVMDSPTELADYKENSWEVTNPDGRKQAIHLTIHSVDGQNVIDNFSKMLQRLVQEEMAVFGKLPNYDYGNYTFLDDVYPTVSGDGMEHRNSTCIVQPAAKIEGNEKRLLGTFAHEYFHSWNVERIRPKTLEPFNFEHANMSNELWLAEGFTQYYGGLLLERAGFDTPEDFYRSAAGLVNSILNTPGGTKYSAIDNSRYAVFADAGVAVDATNKNNMFLSYYTYGGATALALDLQLRSRFNLTLDDFMRRMWVAHPDVSKPYTVADAQTELAALTKDAKFANGFFQEFIYGSGKHDYAAWLDKAGLVLRPARPNVAWAGRIAAQGGRFSEGGSRGAGKGLVIAASTTFGTPVYKAGLDAGDVITAVDGNSIADEAAFNSAIKDKKPGDRVEVTYSNRTGEHKTSIRLEDDPLLEIVTYEKAGKMPSASQLALRNNWLSTKVN